MFVCLLSANKVFVVVVVVCLLFVLLMLFNINFHWCNLLIHFVSMIVSMKRLGAIVLISNLLFKHTREHEARPPHAENKLIQSRLKRFWFYL